MWTREIMGMNVLSLMECFVLYSMLGWAVESIYMSFCNHKLTNRGFGFGPFCPIYGWGATLGYMILQPLENHVISLYIVGALLATCFEFLVGKLMKHFLHEVWWDYNEKPFNFQGIICLESTIAWGFYGLIIVKFLHGTMMKYTEMIPRNVGKVVCMIILFTYMLDFTYHVLLALNIDLPQNVKEKKEKVIETYHSIKNHFN